MRVKKQLFISFLIVTGLVLGSWRGYLALWAEGESSPRTVYEIPSALLPSADQDALEKGIPVRSQRELDRLLEDFLS